jgi:hypothetical protein
MHVDFQAWLVCAVAAAVTVMAAAVGGFLVRGSTAVPAAVWAMLAAASFGLEAAWHAANGPRDPAAADCARLAVAALTFCPIMSILGAKRPQHGVWQFIVAALAGIVALPAASALLVRPGSPPDVHALQQWLMLALPLVAAANYLPTRRAAAAALVVVGQAVLLRRCLPFGAAWPPSAWLDALAACLVAGGAILAAVQSWAAPLRRGTTASEQRAAGDPAAALAGAFLALRETLGAAWSLRIVERFNVVAADRGWPCRLGLNGFGGAEGPANPAWRSEATRTGRALLRRFVSPDWMRRHSPDPADNR